MSKKENKTLTFLRRNAVYFILALCIIAVGVSVTLILTSKNNLPSEQVKVEMPDTDIPSDNVNVPDVPSIDEPVDNTPTPSEPTTPVETVISFIMPVASASEITEYSDTMVFNSTLKRYSAHKAVDFFAEEGTDVVAVYDGIVESVVSSPLTTGVTITVDHGDGLKTVYNSLADGDLVAVGQKVVQGQKIGEVSVSNKQEAKEGAHLHFEVFENGEAIDPAKYLSFDEK